MTCIEVAYLTDNIWCENGIFSHNLSHVSSAGIAVSKVNGFPLLGLDAFADHHVSQTGLDRGVLRRLFVSIFDPWCPTS